MHLKTSARLTQRDRCHVAAVQKQYKNVIDLAVPLSFAVVTVVSCSMWALLMMAVHGAPTGRPGSAYGGRDNPNSDHVVTGQLVASDQRCK
jgi:hypothetical protein